MDYELPVYNIIKANPGCTVSDIWNNLRGPVKDECERVRAARTPFMRWFWSLFITRIFDEHAVGYPISAKIWGTTERLKDLDLIRSAALETTVLGSPAIRIHFYPTGKPYPHKSAAVSGKLNTATS